MMTEYANKEVGEKKIVEDRGLNLVFAQITEPFTAGSPQEEELIWTNLRPGQIQEKLKDRGYEVSYYIAQQLLDINGFKKRSYVKAKSLGESVHRNEQFEHISLLKDRFLEQGCPVLSIDTKKKELIGNFHRKGHYYDRISRKVNDHDFESFATAKIVPHGLYDVGQNKGYLTMGLSADTSSFVVDNIIDHWQKDIQWDYLDKEWLLLLCDGGGSNNCRHYIVKHQLCRLATTLEMNILVAHNPPYCSKWNPIEQRLFSQVDRSWEGCILDSVDTAKILAENTQTKTGLSVKVRLNDNKYQTGLKVKEEFKQNIAKYINFDDKLPQWNYAIEYQNAQLIF